MKATGPDFLPVMFLSTAPMGVTLFRSIAREQDGVSGDWFASVGCTHQEIQMKLTDQDGSFVRWNHRQSEILFSKVQVTKQNAQGGLTLFACLRCFLSDFSTISYHSHIFNSRFVGRVFPFLMQISETMWIMAIGTEMCTSSCQVQLWIHGRVWTWGCPPVIEHRNGKLPINGRFIRKSSVHEEFSS